MSRRNGGLRESRVSRAAALARQLETEIVEKELPAGQRLGTKDDLRQRFSVALPTVNEAIRMLETRGLITVRPGPGGGVFVAARSFRIRSSQLILGLNWPTAEATDTRIVRNALEPLVCREAALYRTADDVRDLRRLLGEMKDAFGQPRLWWARDWALHRRIARICRNAPLYSIYLTLLDFLEEVLDELETPEPQYETLYAIHEEIVAAIEAGAVGERIDTAVAAHLFPRVVDTQLEATEPIA